MLQKHISPRVEWDVEAVVFWNTAWNHRKTRGTSGCSRHGDGRHRRYRDGEHHLRGGTNHLRWFAAAHPRHFNLWRLSRLENQFIIFGYVFMPHSGAAAVQLNQWGDFDVGGSSLEWIHLEAPTSSCSCWFFVQQSLLNPLNFPALQTQELRWRSSRSKVSHVRWWGQDCGLHLLWMWFSE